MMTPRPILSLCALAALAACSDGRDYPRLLPTSQMLATPALPDHAGDAAQSPPDQAVTARAEALRARADTLRRPVIEPETRARMNSAPSG